jgi:hypothetical protein
MLGTVLIFALVAAGAGVPAALAVLVYSFLTGRNPSDDPPRAFIAEFGGFWIASFFLVSSFMVDDWAVAWIFRILMLAFVIAGLVLRAHILKSTAVPEPPSQEPTRTENDTTDLHSE